VKNVGADPNKAIIGNVDFNELIPRRKIDNIFDDLKNYFFNEKNSFIEKFFSNSFKCSFK
jgi:hypothetical protein